MTTSATPPETSSDSGQPVAVPQEIPVQELPVAEPPAAAPVVVTAVPVAAPAKVSDGPRAIIPPSPAVVPYATPTAPKPSQRLISLDALRGFDMFWIIGAENVAMAICKQWNTKATAIVAEQLDHVPWRGFHFYDLIFPMFVFIVGVSMVFSLSKAVERGGKAAAVRRVIIRGIVLYLLGVIYYGGFSHSFGYMYKHHHQPVPDISSNFGKVIADIRFLGVLQRIAISYMVTGLLFCLFKPRTLMIICAGLLLLYWGLLVAVHPGQEHHSYDEGKNLTNYIDAHYLPGFKWDGDHDPEGILSTIPAIGGCLLGVFAGLLLHTPRLGGYQKAGLLVVGGALLILIGMVWGGMPINLQEGGWTLPELAQFPVIKKLWTSSFVMLTAGCASVLLGVFYLVIDVWKLRIIAAPFVWIGMNAITLYLVWNIFELDKLASRFIGGSGTELGKHSPDWFLRLAPPIVALAMILLLARFLYKRQIFLRV